MTRQALLQQAAAEKVAVILSVCGSTGTWCSTHPGSLAISVLNTGGTPATIVAVYATYNGQNAILPAAPQYLTKPTYLNVTLPITLGVGASTGGMTGCGGTNCNLGVLVTALSPATYTLSNPVLVYILTARGNSFPAQYPPIPAVTTITTTTTNAVSSTTITSSAAGGAGGSALVVQMAASPPQSLSGVTVTDSVLVYNYAATAVSGVSLNPSPPTSSTTGTASLTGGSCTPASYPTIPAYSGSGFAQSITFTCTYTAQTGAVGGFASFSGYAQGTLSGNLITSAQTISNTIQIGGSVNVLAQGPFSANFFFFKYSPVPTAPPATPVRTRIRPISRATQARCPQRPSVASPTAPPSAAGATITSHTICR